MPTAAPTNDFGLTAIAAYDEMVDQASIEQQMQTAGHPVERHELAHIAGMGGNAYLLCYTSPKTDRPVTVLVVPHRYDVDRWAEDYYYFEGMTVADAQPGDPARWADLYDRCTALA